MRNKLLLLAIVGMTFASCQKETVGIPVPVQEDAYWYIYVDGAQSDPFKLWFSANYAPYSNTWQYENILCCNISPILIKMQVGKAYTVSYMGRDSVMHNIFHAPTKVDVFYDHVPATTY